MKSFSQSKFTSLSRERQVQILLDTIYKTEEAWGDGSERQRLIILLAEYFGWLELEEIEEPLLNRVSVFSESLNSEISLRTLLDLAVPFERFLDRSVKDPQMIQVRVGDQVSKPSDPLPLFFVLDHLRSSFNVGSLFRTAECMGVGHIYLVGYTPTPQDLGVQKTAMGTEKAVSWSTHHHLQEVIDQLSKKQVPLVALETAESAQSLLGWTAPSSVALLVGNERFGLSQKSLQMVDQIIEIPLMGQKNSLNVANALSVTTFEIVRQWKA